MRYTFSKLMVDEIKTTHAVVVALISLILALISTFQVSLLGDIPVVVVCGGFLISIAVMMFLYSALSSVITFINERENVQITVGALPKVTNIVFDDEEETIIILLSDDVNILVQVNTLVSVYYSDVNERLIAIGHVLKLQSGNDKKIEVCVYPQEKCKDLWGRIKDKQEEHMSRIIVSCCIDKSSIPKGYLDEETTVVNKLIKGATVKEENGVQL